MQSHLPAEIINTQRLFTVGTVSDSIIMVDQGEEGIDFFRSTVPPCVTGGIQHQIRIQFADIAFGKTF